MISRERFEAWHEQWRAKYGPGSGHSDDMLDAWQAAEQMTLERVIEQFKYFTRIWPRDDFVQAVRDLMEPK